MKTFTIVSQLAVAAVLTAFVGIAASARIAEDHAEKRTPGPPDDPTGDDIVVTGQSLEETLPQELARYGSDIETVTAARGRSSRCPTEDRPSRAGARNRPAGP